VGGQVVHQVLEDVLGFGEHLVQGGTVDFGGLQVVVQRLAVVIGAQHVRGHVVFPLVAEWMVPETAGDGTDRWARQDAAEHAAERQAAQHVGDCGGVDPVQLLDLEQLVGAHVPAEPVQCVCRAHTPNLLCG
jgi:hypothetical protein